MAWVFACATEARGPGGDVMLNASLAVPKNAATPFHPATDDPRADLAAFDADPAPRDPLAQARRLNARGCVLAMHAALGGAKATPLPWRPEHESPGWWGRLVRQFAPHADVFTCGDWNELVARVESYGPDARGLAWIRREIRGVEASGHLLYAHHNNGQVALVDPMVGRLGRAEAEGVRHLTLAVAPSPERAPGPALAEPRWRAPAESFDAAVAKAEAWLREVYGGEVVLLAPSPADEGPRGWLFACNTRSFAETGHWAGGMLDAALVVPRDGTQPFALPNSAPWPWLRQWQEGGTPRGAPPKPGPAAWLNATLNQLGGVISTSDHADWRSVTAELVSFPEGSRAVIWLRRSDHRGRESVGLLLSGMRTANGIVLLDSMTGKAADLETEGVRALHLFRYR
ncbi:YrhB domain-containing protein [Streptomyces sp. DSM 44915]|uniref:YrhB domain-containing protein n=1 Tax=Streptomyces chisholmiae TaxID=3075540 RepID=A0ABU2JWN0_9ACTN|nr:YrhB domain-containing protein [Streptomyces sp. DSM 44915]MDT0269151.1 YrhB domain-containing protein [Streptomyces sp. DSM 44915]